MQCNWGFSRLSMFILCQQDASSQECERLIAAGRFDAGYQLEDRPGLDR
jgi:hypothetical protein